jgi:hypothetical protein
MWCLPESAFNEMDKDLTAEDVGALKLSNNGKSLGIDGIPYEFYIRQVPPYTYLKLPKTLEIVVVNSAVKIPWSTRGGRNLWLSGCECRTPS